MVSGSKRHILRLFLDCGEDSCTMPAISPDSRQVAYARATAPLTPSMPIGAPRIRVVNVETGETIRFMPILRLSVLSRTGRPMEIHYIV